MKLDITKPVRTRDGRPVRVLCTDKKGNFPIVALITDGNEKETVCTYNTEGHYYSSGGVCDADLVNVPERVERWLNIYHPKRWARPEFEKSLEDANCMAGDNRLGVLHIVYEGDKVISTSYTAV